MKVKFNTKKIDCYPRWDGLIVRMFSDDESLEQAIWDLMELHVNGVGELTVTIEKPQRKRTMTANAYFWVLCEELAKATGTDKETIYKALIRRVGVFSYQWMKPMAVKRFQQIWADNGLGWFAEEEPSGIDGLCQLKVYYGSSTYTGQEMARLIDEAIAECKDHGIRTMPKKDIEKLKGEWNEKQNASGPVVL